MKALQEAFRHGWAFACVCGVCARVCRLIRALGLRRIRPGRRLSRLRDRKAGVRVCVCVCVISWWQWGEPDINKHSWEATKCIYVQYLSKCADIQSLVNNNKCKDEPVENNNNNNKMTNKKVLLLTKWSTGLKTCTRKKRSSDFVGLIWTTANSYTQSKRFTLFSCYPIVTY